MRGNKNKRNEENEANFYINGVKRLENEMKERLDKKILIIMRIIIIQKKKKE